MSRLDSEEILTQVMIDELNFDKSLINDKNEYAKINDSKSIDLTSS